MNDTSLITSIMIFWGGLCLSSMILGSFSEKRILVKSDIDGRYYRVLEKSGKFQADRLATVNKRITRLVDFMVNTVSSSEKYKDYKQGILRLKRVYTPVILMENSLENAKNVAFTVNKGEELHLCIKEKDTLNDLMFVVLHELAHICNKTQGHDTSFVDYFKFIIRQAVESGVYQFVDYSRDPVNFCDTPIKNTPVRNI